MALKVHRWRPTINIATLPVDVLRGYLKEDVVACSVASKPNPTVPGGPYRDGRDNKYRILFDEGDIHIWEYNGTKWVFREYIREQRVHEVPVQEDDRRHAAVDEVRAWAVWFLLKARLAEVANIQRYAELALTHASSGMQVIVPTAVDVLNIVEPVLAKSRRQLMEDYIYLHGNCEEFHNTFLPPPSWWGDEQLPGE